MYNEGWRFANRDALEMLFQTLSRGNLVRVVPLAALFEEAFCLFGTALLPKNSLIN